MYLGRSFMRKGESAPKGTDAFFDTRLCFQSRDLYFACINKQNREGSIIVYD